MWQAKQESLDRLVAVKVDHRPLSEDKERRRFLREAGAAGRLSNHRGIVTVHDAGILSDGRPYLVMDLCTGGSLTQWLKPGERRSQRRIRDVGVRIADALAAAHARGVLHRDVKPANILIDSYDDPGLADFGLAAMPEAGVELSVTLEGMTPAYAPKEVLYLSPPTEYGDVYSLAATLYALLDGKPPRWPDTGTPSLPQVLELLQQPIEPLPHVDPEFMDVLLRAMDDDPTRRPPAAEFRDQLEALTFAPSTNTDTTVLPGGSTALASPQTGTTGAAVGAGVGAGAAVSGVRAGAVPGDHTTAAGREADPAHDGADDSPPRGGRGASPVTSLNSRRRRALTAIAVVAAILVALLAVQLFDGGPTAGVANPVPSVSAVPTVATTSATTSSPSPSPTPAPMPEGFVDCSKELGGQSYCLTEPECWEQLRGYADSLLIAEMQPCDEEHAEQTFAVGLLSSPVNRQSQLEAKKEVKALCTPENLSKVMAPRKPLKDWQISAIPPQVTIETDNFFRCLFNNPGGSTGAVKLKVPSR